MLTAAYRQMFRVLVLLSIFWSGENANQTLTSIKVQPSNTVSSPKLIQPMPTTPSPQIQPSRVATSVSTQSGVTSHTFSSNQTTVVPHDKDEKLKPYVIIIIAASAAIFLLITVILIVLCVFRRRRSQRLERERNLSYNNMNYESTVKFRSDDVDIDGLNSERKATPASKTNPKRDAGYELVDLPSDKNGQKREYENVTPQHVKETASPDRRYENVTPAILSANGSKDPAAPYEEVFLDSPGKNVTDEKSRNDKHYEIVELK